MSTLDLTVVTSPAHVLSDGKNTFSPITSTLVHGDSDVVLVDTPYLADDIQAVGDRIEALGRRLTTIYITHAHVDHYFGIDALVKRFPSARAVAAPEVAAAISAGAERGAAMFGRLFPELGVVPQPLPQPLDDRVIDLEGHDLRALPPGQGDISPSAGLHIPALDAVVAGDVVYNEIHAMLAFGGPEQWQGWIDNLDRIAELEPRIVVSGHKKPGSADDGARQIDETRRYIQDFAASIQAGGSYQEVVDTMSTKYPHFGNLTTLKTSASAATGGPLTMTDL